MSDLVERRRLPVIAGAVAPERKSVKREPNLRALARALEDRVQGEVRFDDGARGLYAADASNYRHVPLGVVMPRDREDVIATVELCRAEGVPIVPRGGGTSLGGQACGGGVVIDTSRFMTHLLDIDADRRIARVQPGVVFDDLRRAAEARGLTFGPDPSTHAWCTLGGMIGNNSCGVHALYAGRTADNVYALDVLLYDGTELPLANTTPAELERLCADPGRTGDIYRGLSSIRDRYGALVRERFPDIPRRVSGYNLDELLPENGFHAARTLVGSEGTLAFVLEATVRLVPSPRERVLAVLGFDDIFEAADAVPEILGARPIGLEAIDELLVRFMTAKGLRAENLDLLPEGKGFLLVELGGNLAGEAEHQAQRLLGALGRTEGARSKLFGDPRQAKKLWEIREAGLGATARVPGRPDAWPGWEDAAVPPARLGSYLRRFRQLMDRHGYEASLYGHFGDGCVHCRIDFDLLSARGIARYEAFIVEAAHLVAEHGGSLSGEHGDGRVRSSLLPIMFGERIVEGFRELKTLFEPEDRMNPGVGAAASTSPTQDLRLGSSYAPPPQQTYFSFRSDEGSLARATTRCVGVGKCRREEGGTMCPSYMVTREEQHSTRGRAHLLFEMLQGNPVSGGWRDRHVKDALDLCLACKGCKGDCPVHVDVATYKAEFLAHYWEHRPRPLSAYAMGYIDVWARLAEPLLWLANALVGDTALGRLARSLVGLAPERPAPAFARHTFRSLVRRRKRRARPNGQRVVLWADTFNDHFHPEIGVAALEALEALGYDVVVPRRRLCCGRPLYDFGLLARAKRLLGEVIDALRMEARAGTPIVVLEPSCLAVLRDELLDLHPQDYDAHRIAGQAVSIAELLVRHPPAREVPKLDGQVLLHGHCHEKSILGFEETVRVLSDLGLSLDVPDTGCCGLAGAFGYEAQHYEVAQKVGERVLFPAVRAADAATLIVTDGFSCRSQIAHGTERQALHSAQLLQRAIASRPPGGAQEKS